MLSAAVLALAGAVSALPNRGAAHRLAAIRPARSVGRPRRPPVLLVAFGMPLFVGAIVVLGAGGAVAVVLLGGTAWHRWRAGRVARGRLRAAEAMAKALGALVAELRRGAHPVVAADVAAEAEPAAAPAMTAVATAARLGGNVASALSQVAAADPDVAGVLGQVARAWSLAQRHGVPLADVLDAVRRDLRQRVRFAGNVRARLAGARASAVVLAVLPVFGVLLGEAMGARPLTVLADTTVGQVLLVVGAALVSAGMLWSSRITERVGLP